MQEYMIDLLSKLDAHKANALKQKGKCEMEKHVYETEVDTWYKQVEERIKDNPPTDYVRSLHILCDVYQCIADLKYIYLEKGEYGGHLSISLFWKES